MTWFSSPHPYESPERETSIHALVGRRQEKSQGLTCGALCNTCVSVTATAAAGRLHYVLLSQYRQSRMMEGLCLAGHLDYLRGHVWLSGPCVCWQSGFDPRPSRVSLFCQPGTRAHRNTQSRLSHCSFKALLRLQFCIKLCCYLDVNMGDINN